MARYFFHFRNGSEFVEDEEGADMPDAAAARATAILSARELIADAFKGGQFLVGQFEIYDQNGELSDVVAFRDVLA